MTKTELVYTKQGVSDILNMGMSESKDRFDSNPKQRTKSIIEAYENYLKKLDGPKDDFMPETDAEILFSTMFWSCVDAQYVEMPGGMLIGKDGKAYFNNDVKEGEKVFTHTMYRELNNILNSNIPR